MLAVLQAYENAGSLSPMQRRLLSLCASINEDARFKRLQRMFLHMVGKRWVRACTRNLLDVKGLEHAFELEPERGVLVCSNHRSFFDMYVISSVFLCAGVPWFRDQFYPVRMKFFYERWTGLAVNLIMGGGCMYPPIFRDRQQADLNKVSVKRVVSFLQKPGVVVGMHPEGTRGKGPDPYQLLRAQPGIGQMALQAKVPVLPVWVHGLGNDLPRQILSNFGPPERRGEPIVIRVGESVDLADLRQKRGRITLYKQAADRILDKIRALGESSRVEPAV